jgi:CrcB protein
LIWVAIALGGAIGAAARHALNTVVQLRWGSASFPAGIFAVNAIGCLAIGLLAGLIAADRVSVPGPVRAFLMVGVVGGFTTFSSYALDTLVLVRGGQPGLAAVNALGQVVSGLVAAWIGFAAASWRA